MRKRLWRHVIAAGEVACWEWQGRKNPKGYGKMKVGKRDCYAHRLVYEDVYGPIPEGMCVCHRCDNPSCVRPDHLFLGTLADNVADKVRKGRQPRGEAHGQSKLTVRQVIDMRKRYRAGGVSMHDLARESGVSVATIHEMLHRGTWDWVEEPKEAACQ